MVAFLGRMAVSGGWRRGGEGVRLFYFCLFPSIPEDFNGLLGRAELQPTDGLTMDREF